MKSTCVYPVALMAAFALAVSKGQSPPAASQPNSSADPAKFVVLYEDTGKEKRLLYDSETSGKKFRNNIKVDSASSLIVRIQGDRITTNTALNQLLITAQLASGDKTSAIPVSGYSEIGKDQTTGTSQQAVSVQTAAQIGAFMQNFYWTARDILDQDLPGCRKDLEDHPRDASLPGLDPKTCPFPKDLLSRVQSTFKSLQPETKSIPQFFTDPHNKSVADFLGSNIFGMDSATLQAVAASFQTLEEGLSAQPSSNDTSSTQSSAAQALATRVWLAYRDIRLDYAEHSAGESDFDTYLNDTPKRLFEVLKQNIVPGQIDLSPAGAKDGDTLTITVESKAIDGNGTSAVLKLNVLIKNYGYRVATSPSLMFIRRIGVTEADKTTQNLNSVRFAPAPGITYGVTFLPRQPIGSALAPGLGANLSFMNYDDPADFNVTTGKFSTTTGANVQFGAGVEFSLFNNMLQATYGWNLNAPQKRAYWGLGFGFLDVAKYLTNKFGK